MERFRTTRETKDVLERLSRATGVRRNYWSRAALGLSLSLEGELSDTETLDSEGMEHSRQMIFGEDEATLLALIRQRHQNNSDDATLAKLVKLHVERGTRLIQKEFERLNRRGDELLLQLLQRCGAPSTAGAVFGIDVPAPPMTSSFRVNAVLGEDALSGKPVTHTLNRPGSAPHVAVMGRTRSGKTRTALTLLAQMAKTIDYQIPCLVFDYAKGDIAANREFVAAVQANVISLPTDLIPIAPLALLHTDEHAVNTAAHRFRSTLCAVVRGLGPKQKNRCLDIIRDAYQHAAGGTPDMSDVLAVAAHLYADNAWADDSLIACLREFTDVPIFRTAASGIRHDLLRSSHVIDVHNLPEDLRKLTVFLVLDRLYAELSSMADAPMDSEGNRQLRLNLVIDEAHHYLLCKQPTLENMVRELASKGVAIWLLSQSPDDFDQPSYNFAREMGLVMVFSCVVERPKMLEALLGGKINPQRLSQLGAGVALTRLPGPDSRPIEVRAWKP